jgi:hypothetical protein
LSERKKKIVEKAFGQFDSKGEGKISVFDVANNYEVS